jgi:rhodanese-related sulfurtransferase
MSLGSRNPFPAASLAALLLVLLGCSVSSAQEVETLTAQSLYNGMQEGLFSAVIDVRSEMEWNSGHMENATLVADLGSAESPLISLLSGCETCTLAVTCRSGARASAAIYRLQTEFNFTGTLYNGMGTSQWTMSGFPLVKTESVTPPCAGSSSGSCARQQQGLDTTTTTTNITAPTAAPTGSPPVAAVTSPGFSLTAGPTLKPVIDEDEFGDDGFWDDFTNATDNDNDDSTNQTIRPSAMPSVSPSTSETTGTFATPMDTTIAASLNGADASSSPSTTTRRQAVLATVCVSSLLLLVL